MAQSSISNLITKIAHGLVFEKKESKKYKRIFDELKPEIIRIFEEFLDQQKITNRGRPRTIDLGKFFDCLFCVCDNALKLCYTQPMFGIPRSTYCYYSKILRETQFFELLHRSITNHFVPPERIEYVVCDSYTFKSADGNECVGSNPTDRGRNGSKTSLIMDQNLVTHAVYIAPANDHDAKILLPTIEQSVTDLKGKKCLADKGYAGWKFARQIREATGVKLITKPKKRHSPKEKIQLILKPDALLLKQKRNRIERLNQNIRNFRILNVKYNKKIGTYRMYLFLVLTCINCYMIMGNL